MIKGIQAKSKRGEKECESNKPPVLPENKSAQHHVYTKRFPSAKTFTSVLLWSYNANMNVGSM